MSWTLLGEDTKLSLLSTSVMIFLRTFNIFNCGSKFFNEKLPSHNMLHIKVFIGEIFVVSINHNLLSQKDVFDPFESFDD